MKQEQDYDANFISYWEYRQIEKNTDGLGLQRQRKYHENGGPGI